MGELLARQAEEFALDEEMEKKFGETCEGLPNDLINFLHDPVACAIALGWDEGVEIVEIPLELKEEDNWLHEYVNPSGKPTRVVTRVNGARFNEFWLNMITKVK